MLNRHAAAAEHAPRERFKLLWKGALPEQADALLVVPLDHASQGLAVLQSQVADVVQALLQEGLLNAGSVGEDGRTLLPQIHVQAGIPAAEGRASQRVTNKSIQAQAMRKQGCTESKAVVGYCMSLP